MDDCSSHVDDLVLVRGQRRVLERIAEGCPIGDVLAELCTAIEDAIEGTKCSILLLDVDGVHLRHGAAPSLPEGYIQAIDGAPIGPSAGSCGTAMHDTRLVIVEDVANDPLWADYRDVALSFGLAACASVPIVAGPTRSVLGSFAIYHAAPGPFSDRELRLLTSMTDLAAVAIVNHRRERALRASEEALARMQKAESLAVLAGGIAHDFNNLLTAMVGHLELLGSRVAHDERAATLVRDLDGFAEQAASFTHQLLAYAGRATLEMRAHDLGAIVSDVLRLIAVSVPKKIDLLLDFAADLPAIQADPAQIKQVALNLVTNAAEAIGDAPGEIRVRTRAESLDEEAIRARFPGQTLDPGTYVVLEVSDTGSGMSSEVLARIFDPFFTTKFSGRGLGLAAMLGILRSHRGGFELESEVGRGSRFSLYFPALEGRAPARSERPPPVPRGRLGEGRLVLLVEDEAIVRSTARSLLEHLGFLVVEARDGHEALEVLEEHAAEVSVVLMDMTMPRMDGREATEAIASRWPSVPVILTSGYAEREVTTGDRARPVAFLPKPYAIDDLERALGRALAARVASS